MNEIFTETSSVLSAAPRQIYLGHSSDYSFKPCDCFSAPLCRSAMNSLQLDAEWQPEVKALQELGTNGAMMLFAAS